MTVLVGALTLSGLASALFLRGASSPSAPGSEVPYQRVGGTELAYDDGECDGVYASLDGLVGVQQTFRLADFGLTPTHQVAEIAVYVGPQSRELVLGAELIDRGTGVRRSLGADVPLHPRDAGRIAGWRVLEAEFAGVTGATFAVNLGALGGIGTVCLDTDGRVSGNSAEASRVGNRDPKETPLAANLLVHALVVESDPVTIEDAVATVQDLSERAFGEPSAQRKAALLNALDAVARQADAGNRRGAAERIENDLMPKVSLERTGGWLTDAAASQALTTVFFVQIANYADECFGVSATAYVSKGLNVVLGTAGDDLLTGTDGGDLIFGGAGEDVISGLGGDDVICAGPGDGPNDSNLVSGGAGNDALWGGAGKDTLNGGDDSDVLVGGDGNDNLNGGPGDDWVLYGENGEDVLNGGEGDDLLDGGGDDDTLFGGGGEDSLLGDGLLNPPNQGDDTLFGGPGENSLVGDWGDDTLFGGDAGSMLSGDNGNDDLFGGTGPDYIFGGAGNDFITAGGGIDTIEGGYGNDIASGGSQDDTINGGEGNDVLNGNDGVDTMYGGNGDDTVNGGNGDDLLGDPGDEWGDDTFDGGAGFDYIYAGTYQKPNEPGSGDYDHCYVDPGENQFGCEVLH